MTFPRRLLTDHEDLILDLRPHWIALTGPVLVTVAVVVGWVLTWQWTGRTGVGPGLRWAGLGVGLVILIAYPLRKFIDWVTDNFVVTTDRLIHRRGLIAKNSMEIPLEAINDVRFRQSIVDRVVGAGTLVIQSASEQGREEFKFIRDPERVQKTIYEMGEANQQRMFAGGTKHTAESGLTVAEEIHKLDQLRDEGVLTEEEFAAQKAKLLGGGAGTGTTT